MMDQTQKKLNCPGRVKVVKGSVNLKQLKNYFRREREYNGHYDSYREIRLCITSCNSLRCNTEEAQTRLRVISTQLIKTDVTRLLMRVSTAKEIRPRDSALVFCGIVRLRACSHLIAV